MPTVSVTGHRSPLGEALYRCSSGGIWIVAASFALLGAVADLAY